MTFTQTQNYLTSLKKICKRSNKKAEFLTTLWWSNRRVLTLRWLMFKIYPNTKKSKQGKSSRKTAFMHCHLPISVWNLLLWTINQFIVRSTWKLKHKIHKVASNRLNWKKKFSNNKKRQMILLRNSTTYQKERKSKSVLETFWMTTLVLRRQNPKNLPQPQLQWENHKNNAKKNCKNKTNTNQAKQNASSQVTKKPHKSTVQHHPNRWKLKPLKPN